MSYLTLFWCQAFNKLIQSFPEVVGLIAAIKELADLDLKHTILTRA